MCCALNMVKVQVVTCDSRVATCGRAFCGGELPGHPDVREFSLSQHLRILPIFFHFSGFLAFVASSYDGGGCRSLVKTAKNFAFSSAISLSCFFLDSSSAFSRCALFSGAKKNIMPEFLPSTRTLERRMQSDDEGV